MKTSPTISTLRLTIQVLSFSHKFRRSLAIIDLAANLAVDGPQAADGSALSSRDVEANSAPDAVADVERSPNSPGFSPRAGGPAYDITIDVFKLNMLFLNADDKKCSARAAAAPPLKSRSLDIEKRVDHGPMEHSPGDSRGYGRLHLSRLGQ